VSVRRWDDRAKVKGASYAQPFSSYLPIIEKLLIKETMKNQLKLKDIVCFKGYIEFDE
jgi:hypothetical protein